AAVTDVSERSTSAWVARASVFAASAKARTVSRPPDDSVIERGTWTDAVRSTGVSPTSPSPHRSSFPESASSQDGEYLVQGSDGKALSRSVAAFATPPSACTRTVYVSARSGPMAVTPPGAMSIRNRTDGFSLETAAAVGAASISDGTAKAIAARSLLRRPVCNPFPSHGFLCPYGCQGGGDAAPGADSYCHVRAGVTCITPIMTLFRRVKTLLRRIGWVAGRGDTGGGGRSLAGARVRSAGASGGRGGRDGAVGADGGLRAADADHLPPDADAGEPGLRSPGAVQALRPGPAPGPARRGRQPAAGHVGAARPGPSRGRGRRDGQHGGPGGRRGRVRRAGAVPALHADVHRGGPARPAALHRGGEGAAVAAPRRARQGDPRPHGHGAAHAQHPDVPGSPSGGARAGART